MSPVLFLFRKFFRARVIELAWRWAAGRGGGARERGHEDAGVEDRRRRGSPALCFLPQQTRVTPFPPSPSFSHAIVRGLPLEHGTGHGIDWFEKSAGVPPVCATLSCPPEGVLSEASPRISPVASPLAHRCSRRRARPQHRSLGAIPCEKIGRWGSLVQRRCFDAGDRRCLLTPRITRELSFGQYS